MAFGPEGIAAWHNMLFNMDKNRAQAPYLEDMAIAARDKARLEASGTDPTSQYKMAMAAYLSNPNMALKGFTNPTKNLLEQSFVNAPGGLANLITPNNTIPAPTYPGGIATPPPPQQLPLTDQQINNLKKYAVTTTTEKPQKNLGIQPDGTMATNNEVTMQTGGNASLNDVNNMYNRERTLKTTDALLRKRIDYAQHLETTLDQIDPSIFQIYSGAKGKVKFANDYAKSLTGNAPEEFQKYQSLVKVIAPMFAGEIRQFQGDSVREGVRELFESLANPTTWQDPQVAEHNFNTLRTVLGSELSNDLNLAEKGPNYDKMQERAQKDIRNEPVYGENIPSSQIQQAQQTKSLGGKTYVNIDGEWHET